MAKKEKIMLVGLLVIVVLFISIVFIFSMEPGYAPDIYFTSESGATAKAVKGGFTWNSFGKSVIADAAAPSEYVYESENTLLVKPGEKITFGNKGRKYNFLVEYMKYYNSTGNEVEVTPEDDSVYKNVKDMLITAPMEDGIYIYNFKLDYHKKGEAEYGVKIVVSSEPVYDIASIIQYKDTYIGNASKVGAILNKLPFSNNRNGIILRTVNLPYELLVKYNNIEVEKADLLNSSIALFALIPNLDVINYEIELEDKTIVYTREEVETIKGRDLTEYANDANLWQREVFYKDKVEQKEELTNLYKLVISNILSSENIKNLKYFAIDIDSFGEELKLSNADKRKLLNYCGQTLDVVMEMSLEKLKEQAITGGILIYVNEAVKTENGYNLNINIYKSETQKTTKIYNAEFNNEQWILNEI